MDALGRSAGLLAVIGGVLVAVIVSMLSFQPDSAGTSVTWYGLFAGIVLLGLAVAGLYRRTRASVGRLGRASAWLSGIGAVATIAMVLYFVGTGQILAIQQALPDGPVGMVAMGASLAWLAGNLGFAVAIVRTRALPRLGAWLVLAGAAVPIGLVPFTTDGAASPLATVGAVAFLLMPLGWIVLGLAATRSPSATRSQAATHPTAVA